MLSSIVCYTGMYFGSQETDHNRETAAVHFTNHLGEEEFPANTDGSVEFVRLGSKRGST